MQSRIPGTAGLRAPSSGRQCGGVELLRSTAHRIAMEFGDRPGPGAGGETVAKTGLRQKPHGRGGERGRVVHGHRQAGLVMAAHPGHPAVRNRGLFRFLVRASRDLWAFLLGEGRFPRHSHLSPEDPNRGVDHRAAARHGLDLHQPISLAACVRGEPEGVRGQVVGGQVVVARYVSQIPGPVLEIEACREVFQPRTRRPMVVKSVSIPP